MKVLDNYKIFENMQQAKKTLKELHIDEKNPDFLRLKEMLKNNSGYMGKFTDWLFRDHETFELLQSIYDQLKVIKIDKKIEEFKRAEDLFDYLQSFGINTKVKQLINALPSRTREYVTDDLKQLLSMNLKYFKQIKDFYSHKGGREVFKNSHQLYDSTMTIIENNAGAFNLETVLKKLEGRNVEIMVALPSILMVKVLDYETSKAIGSPHWCIVTDPSMWTHYVDGSTVQYFIWDFTKKISDKRHMLGLTYGMFDNINNAHWADDSECENPKEVLEEYDDYE